MRRVESSPVQQVKPSPVFPSLLTDTVRYSQLKGVKGYGQNLRLGFKMGFEKLVMCVKRQKET